MTSSNTQSLRERHLSPRLYTSKIKRAGFTLLELLIVLFLLSLGYATLFSSGFGQQTTTADDVQNTVTQSRNIVRYARRLAISKGSPVAVTINADSIQLHNLDATTVPSPGNSNQAYQLDSAFALSQSELLLRSSETVASFYFDEDGRITSRVSDSESFQPFKTPIAIAMANYDNGNDDGSYATTDTAFLLISNVTGELIPL